MSEQVTPSRPRRVRVTLASLGAAALVVAGAIAILAPDDQGPTASAALAATSSTAPASPATPATPWTSTRFRAATFNVLGYSHTSSRGDARAGRLDGRTRQLRVNQLVRANGLSIVGFQELEQPQIDVFLKEMGSAYDLFPGNAYTGSFSVNVRGNSIAWRKDQWEAISKTYYNAPYYKGYNVPRPLVLLRNRQTGQRLYVSNTHNAANNFKGAQAQRNAAVAIQAKLFTTLRRQSPTTPIIFVGDMNDKRQFFCDLTAKSTLRAVQGGIRTATSCTLPRSYGIDWMTSTTDIQWNGYQSVRTAYVKTASDHPLIWADATIQAPQAAAAGIDRAVVVDVQGLPSAAISGSRASWAPHLKALRASGASTLNARTTAEAATPLQNTVSILTGRPVLKKFGGHGVTFGTDKPRMKKYRTFKSATGSYINTLFDTVHNQGGSTSFMSSDRNAAIVIRSAQAGLTDSQGVDYGKNKLTVSSIRTDDAAAMTVIQKQITSHPRTLSYVQLTGPRIAGEKYGYFSAQYAKAVKIADKRVGQILATIKASSRTARSTALIVTASAGGAGKATKGTQLTQAQVPLMVWANGVPAGSDLYAMNPTFKDPGSARVAYTGVQPLRNSNAANVVTTMLGYPTMPTPSTFGGSINVFQPAHLVQRR